MFTIVGAVPGVSLVKEEVLSSKFLLPGVPEGAHAPPGLRQWPSHRLRSTSSYYLLKPYCKFPGFTHSVARAHGIPCVEPVDLTGRIP